MKLLLHSAHEAWRILRKEGVRGFATKVAQKVRHMRRVSTFKPYVRTLRPAGVTIKVPIVDLFSEDWYGDWLDTSSELEWIKRTLLEPGDIVADCGANIGFTSAFFARCVGPAGRVYAFEPVPRNARAAARSAELNDIRNLVVVNAAVGSTRGAVTVSTGFGNAVVDPAGGDLRVPVVTLDDQFGGRKPDFVKIDVEGYELQVLRGAGTLLSSRPKLAIEIHCSALARPVEEVAAILELLNLSDGEAHLQLTVEGPIEPFQPRLHTPEMIARFNNVHLFVKPHRTPPPR